MVFLLDIEAMDTRIATAVSLYYYFLSVVTSSVLLFSYQLFGNYFVVILFL